ncbi:PREDICTED: circadian-associated transcriptional repressor [Nanorana parkeri]|uniref:circadian-associated transcriptional repressor n=1 Tax=Nanorana parkeri TaxID=125878 RepID=UPI00085498FD|nr:PREDICTED: circadian-associated transcriptional repressor [Nanorana parkeri]
MEDTESSDFLSSSDSLWSSASTTTSNHHEDPSYVSFDVFLSEGMPAPAKGKKDFEAVRMIPNSQLTSASHPVLIHLENEYQARRSFWHQHTGQYCSYSGEVEGWSSYPSKSKLTGRGSPVTSRRQDKQLKDLVFPDGSNYEAHQGLKRQRIQDATLLANRWKERKEKDFPISDGDRLFAEKCRELQGFIQPLTELLNGLKRGRYDRGLNSFQQSVAMDRIQRIVGVLQKPEMGERYLGTLLQVEMMLKIWFPGVSSSSSSSSSSSDFDMEEPQNKMAKSPVVGSTGQKSCHQRPVLSSSGPNIRKPHESHNLGQVECVCCKEAMAEWPTMNLTWMHSAPICNPPLSQVDLHRLNTALGQDLLWPNGNSCGVIFLVQNSQASASSTMESVYSEDKPLDLRYLGKGAQEQFPSRSKSTPAVFSLGNKSGLRHLKTHSHSLAHLPTSTQTFGEENT